MFKNNNKIGLFQLFSLGAMTGNALFVGIGTILTIKSTHEDTWLVAPISLIIGLIPIFLITRIMNYFPELNLIDKIKNIFGKKIGFIINLIFLLIVFTILIIDIWGLGYFANTKYLTETPVFFIVLLFMLPILYANLKGIETISRTSLILTYIVIICHITITTSLIRFSSFSNVKPILVNGIGPVLMSSLRYLSFCITPMITLLIIPKNKICNNKKSTLAIFMGYIFATIIMSIVFYMCTSTIGYNIAKMYKYPEYFVLKKISLGHNINNVENFFSLIWIYNMIVCAMMCLYYVKEYLQSIIKSNKKNIHNWLLSILALIIVFIASNAFQNDTIVNLFMFYQFPIFISVPALILIIIIFIVCLIKTRKLNKVNLKQ